MIDFCYDLFAFSALVVCTHENDANGFTTREEEEPTLKYYISSLIQVTH